MIRPWSYSWTPESIRAFWDWASQAPSTVYFSHAVGPSILGQLGGYLSDHGTVLDIGAGTGELAALLIRRGHKVLAVDDSPASVEHLAARFTGEPAFRGVWPSVADISPGSADAAIAVETIEHLSADLAAGIWRDVARALKPGGRIVLTTPHAEDLTALEVCCPNCGAVFHRVQHLRSFTPRTLVAEMESAGFHTLICQPTYFSPLTGLHGRLERVRRRLGRYPNPHLAYVGERPT